MPFRNEHDVRVVVQPRVVDVVFFPLRRQVDRFRRGDAPEGDHPPDPVAVDGRPVGVGEVGKGVERQARGARVGGERGRARARWKKRGRRLGQSAANADASRDPRARGPAARARSRARDERRDAIVVDRRAASQAVEDVPRAHRRVARSRTGRGGSVREVDGAVRWEIPRSLTRRGFADVDRGRGSRTPRRRAFDPPVYRVHEKHSIAANGQIRRNPRACASDAARSDLIQLRHLLTRASSGDLSRGRLSLRAGKKIHTTRECLHTRRRRRRRRRLSRL